MAALIRIITRFGILGRLCVTAMAPGDLEGEEESVDGIGNPGGPPVRVEGQVARFDAALDEVFSVKVLGEKLVFFVLEGPAHHHQAAEQVDGHAELVPGSPHRAFQVRDVPAPDLVGRQGA